MAVFWSSRKMNSKFESKCNQHNLSSERPRDIAANRYGQP